MLNVVDVRTKLRELIKPDYFLFLITVFLVTAQQLGLLVYYLFEQGLVFLFVLFNNLQNVDLQAFRGRF